MSKVTEALGFSFEPNPDDLVEVVSQYAWNGMEVCRLCNGIEPFDFKGCNYSTQEKAWFDPKGTCKKDERGCRFSYSMIYHRLMKLNKQGRIKSTKMRWIDGRDPGAIDYIPMDNFRYFYTMKSLLSTRLCHDVISKVGTPEYL